MSNVAHLLKKYGIVPSRRRGQNFLFDDNILRKIISVSDLSPKDVVVEIGPGLGVLTQLLASQVKKVIAIEIDAALAKILSQELRAQENVEIVKDDARALPLTRYGAKSGSYRVIANIPYNITSTLIRKFLEESPRPSSLILLVQREVVDRMTARPGHHSLLSLSVQLYATVEMMFPVSRNCFFPKPRVESAVIRITPSAPSKLPSQYLQKKYFDFLHAGFRAKRKLLVSNLSSGLKVSVEHVRTAFQASGISPLARAQDLSVTQWLTLCKVLTDKP